MEAQFSRLTPLVSKYREEILAIENRRQLWNSQTKKTLQSALQAFIDHYQLQECFIDEDNSMVNQEMVFLGFTNEPSGIILKRNGQRLIRFGGGLLYAQNANGKISATIIYPHIENLKGEEGRQKDIGLFMPKELKAELVYDHLEKFFMEICTWECFHREMIGFKNNIEED